MTLRSSVSSAYPVEDVDEGLEGVNVPDRLALAFRLRHLEAVHLELVQIGVRDLELVEAGQRELVQLGQQFLEHGAKVVVIPLLLEPSDAKHATLLETASGQWRQWYLRRRLT